MSRRTAAAARAAAIALSIAAAGCLDDDIDPDAPATSVFIALQSDFQPFRSWERFFVGDAPVDPGHPDAGERYAYLSARPLDGSVFPVGTMIVKATEIGEPSAWVVHAMVKRGGDFNLGGAVGWEWFDLRLDDEGNTVIGWRGFEPPSGHGYGGTGSDAVDCNSCHATGAAWETDYVLSGVLAPGSL